MRNWNVTSLSMPRRPITGQSEFPLGGAAARGVGQGMEQEALIGPSKSFVHSLVPASDPLVRRWAAEAPSVLMAAYLEDRRDAPLARVSAGGRFESSRVDQTRRVGPFDGRSPEQALREVRVLFTEQNTLLPLAQRRAGFCGIPAFWVW